VLLRPGKPAPRFEAHIEVDLLEIGVETHVRDTPRGPKAETVPNFVRDAFC
jgi:hypothetical protein